MYLLVVLFQRLSSSPPNNTSVLIRRYVCRYVDMCVDNVWRRDHLVATVDNEPGQAAAAVAVSCIIVTSNL